MAELRMDVNTTCPACGKDAKWPPDGEGDSVFPCGACGVNLVIKAAVFEDPIRAWLVTQESERQAFAAARTSS